MVSFCTLHGGVSKQTRAPSAAQSSHEKETFDTKRDQSLKTVARVDTIKVIIDAAARDLSSITNEELRN